MEINNKYLITIIISTYNDKNLRGAFQSLRDQTFKRFIVILINDGGYDLKNIINEFSDLNIKFINLINNQGLSKCLNKGIKKLKQNILLEWIRMTYVFLKIRITDKVFRRK